MKYPEFNFEISRVWFLNTHNIDDHKTNINPNVTNTEKHKVVPAQSGGADFDPVRAIHRHKTRRRQKKIDKILRVYGMD